MGDKTAIGGEKNYKTGAWAVVDPFFKNWLIAISL